MTRDQGIKKGKEKGFGKVGGKWRKESGEGEKGTGESGEKERMGEWLAEERGNDAILQKPGAQHTTAQVALGRDPHLAGRTLTRRDTCHSLGFLLPLPGLTLFGSLFLFSSLTPHH